MNSSNGNKNYNYNYNKYLVTYARNTHKQTIVDGYNVKDIIYRWARSTAVEQDKEISLPQFDIVQTVQKYRLEELSSG